MAFDVISVGVPMTVADAGRIGEVRVA